MILSERKRLRRIIRANAQEYARVRRDVALQVMIGTTAEKLADERRALILHAQYVAEAAAALEAEAEEDGS